jgi:hypothetical protein
MTVPDPPGTLDAAGLLGTGLMTFRLGIRANDREHWDRFAIGRSMIVQP